MSCSTSPAFKVPELGVQCWICWKEDPVMAREKRGIPHTQTPKAAREELGFAAT